MKIKCENNPTILNNFLAYLQGILNYSEKTIEGYNLDLIQFFKFIKEYLNIAIDVKDFTVFTCMQVQESDIIAYMVYLNFNRNNTPNTRERKLCAIRKFYKWLLSTTPGNQKENPTKYLPSIRKVVRVPKHLTLEQSRKIQTIFTSENSKFPVRNNTIITLFLNTGMRVSELSNLNIKDIDFNTNSIKVIGKGDRERKVYFSNSCKEQLLKYIQIRNKNNKITDIENALFISKQNKRLSVRTIETICTNAYKLLGIGDLGYTTHTLRHTTATLIYTYVSQDILLLKELLGHKHIASTEIYTHVYNKQLKEAVDKNPLNQIVKKSAA